ncbi:TonB-dependent siderophore receptor [Marinobacter sp.]
MLEKNNKAGTNRKSHSPFIQALMVGASLGLSTTFLPFQIAQAQTQAQDSNEFDINIPSQQLAHALSDLTAQTGFQTAYQTDLVAGLIAPKIQGTMSPDEALSLLLAGTGLQFQYSDSQTIVILPNDLSDGAASSTVAPVVIEATGETATGPVDGYRATRSTSGTRTDTALRDIPQSIQVVPRDVIEDRAATELKDVIQNVSSVQENSTSGNRAATFKVRGFSSPGYSVDGIMLNPAGDRPETFLDLSSVERVEVLKGPASALYGRAEPGGVINIVTRRPSKEFGADSTLTVGSYDFWRAQGSVTGALNASKTLTARLSSGLQTEDSFREAGTSRRQSVTGAIDWQPTEATTVTANVDYTHQNLPFDRGLIVTADNEVSLPADRFLAEKWSRIDAKKAHTTLGLEHQLNSTVKLSGSMVYDQALVQDTGIDLRSLQADGRTLNRRYTDREEDSRSFTSRFDAQFDFDTSSIGHTLLSGLEYSHSQMKFKSYRANIGAIDIYNPVYGADKVTPTLNSNFVEDIDTLSFILQDQIEFTPQWKALTGLRYDTVDQKQDQKVGDSNAPINEDALTKRFGLVYQPIQILSFYTSYGESFSPQSGQTRDGSALSPEEGWQVEAGAKFDLLADRLSVTTSVFQITKENVATTDPEDTNYSVLTGEQRVRGIEINLTGEVLPGWNIITSAAYLDAEVTKDEDYDVGNRLGGVPVWSGSIWNSYEFQSGNLKGLTLGGGVQMVGARKGDLNNSYAVDGYARFDASVAYKITENIELSLNGKNLTDADYIETPVGRTENYAGAPLSIYAAIKVKM